MKLQPVKLSVGTLPLLTEWQNKLSEYIEQHGKDRIQNAVTALCSEDAQFAALVDKAMQSNGVFTESDLEAWAKQNVVKATSLYNQINKLPKTVSALLLGIECIKATADTSALNDEQKAAALDGTLFESYTIDDVQAYCDELLSMR